ncbi:hypothetical protein [Clostridium tertium]|uniref:hypothetical protein n=1 Tax=Clostridium tertium TaxID=1559 RepID=UPI0031D44793
MGSDTGILTKQLLEKGNKVYGIEPNAIAETNLKNFSKFTSVNGSAENTTIYDNSIDIIIRKSIEDVKAYFSSVQAHIIVIMPEDSNEVLKEEDYAANWALIQNFQLAAWERGLGVFWKRDTYL